MVRNRTFAIIYNYQIVLNKESLGLLRFPLFLIWYKNKRYLSLESNFDESLEGSITASLNGKYIYAFLEY